MDLSGNICTKRWTLEWHFEVDQFYIHSTCMGQRHVRALWVLELSWSVEHRRESHSPPLLITYWCLASSSLLDILDVLNSSFLDVPAVHTIKGPQPSSTRDTGFALVHGTGLVPYLSGSSCLVARRVRVPVTGLGTGELPIAILNWFWFAAWSLQHGVRGPVI